MSKGIEIELIRLLSYGDDKKDIGEILGRLVSLPKMNNRSLGSLEKYLV